MKGTLKLLSTVVLAVILFSGCKKVPSVGEPEEIFLTSEAFIPDELLGKPISMTVTDEDFIVTNENSADTLISLFTLQGEYRTDILPKGEGPEAALWVPNVQFSRSNAALYAPDLMRGKILRITDYHSPALRIAKDFDISSAANDSIVFMGRIGRMTDGNYFAANFTPLGMVALLSPEGCPLKTDIPFPDKALVDEKLTDAANAMLYQSMLRMSPAGDFGAIFCNQADVRIFANLKDDEVSFSSFEDAYPNDIYVIQFDADNAQGASTSDSKYYTIDLSLSDNYAYELHSGLPDKEIRETDFFKDIKMIGSDKVRVFDRQGNRIKNITLDRYVTGIAVSPDDSYLYALTQSPEEGFVILRYKL